MNIICPDCGATLIKETLFEKSMSNELICEKKCGYILKYFYANGIGSNITISNDK